MYFDPLDRTPQNITGEDAERVRRLFAETPEDEKTHYYGDSCPGGHGQAVVAHDPDFEGLVYQDDEAKGLIAEVNVARSTMLKLYLVTDESQTGDFISAIVAAVGPRSAKSLVIDEYEMSLGTPYFLTAMEIEMYPTVHGVKYVVKKKGY